MKKLLAILLALTIVTVAFAQPVAKIAFDGTFTLYNQDAAAKVGFNTVGGGTGAFSFSATAADGLSGLTLGLANQYGSHIDPASKPTSGDALAVYPSLAVSSFKGWYFAFDKMVKFSLGRFSWSDYRLLNYWNFDSGYPGTANRILATAYPVAGLELAVSVPFADTAAAAQDAIDAYKSTDLGFKYAIDGFGTVKGFVNLDLVANSNIVAVGVTFTGVKDLNVIANTKFTFGGTNAEAFGVSADYTMDKLVVYGEFDGTNTTAFAWNIYAGAAYTMDKVEFDFDANYNSDATYDATVAATYTIVPGLTAGVNVGYDGTVHYAVPLKFKIAY